MEIFGRFRAGSGDPRTALRFVPSVTAGFIPVGRMILHYRVLNSPMFPSPPGLSQWNGDSALPASLTRHQLPWRLNLAPRNLTQDHQISAHEVSNAAFGRKAGGWRL